MKKIKYYCKLIFFRVLYRLFSFLPLKDAVVGSSFYGMRYENNPRFVFEELQIKAPKLEKIWICDRNFKVDLPDYVTPVYGRIREIYAYATSKVWVNSHFFPYYVKKRTNQLSIFMYHGGIGIKRNSNEVPSRKKTPVPRHSALNTSISISNSSFMNMINRTSLEYDGPILKCGYPKNDPLFEKSKKYKNNVCANYGIPVDKRIVTYAPTYRQNREDVSCYNLDFEKLCKVLSKKFGGDWIAIVRWHPHQSFLIEHTKELFGNNVVDATYYNNMQELIISSDVFISDYSSCIFEAAERKIPCFSFATDWEVFRNEQGVHFEIDKLPFPYCKSTTELITEIERFDLDEYTKALALFFEQQGLFESGKASEIISDIIIEYMTGDINIVSKLKYEDC